MTIGSFLKKRKANFIKGLQVIKQFIEVLLSSDDPLLVGQVEGQLVRSGLYNVLGSLGNISIGEEVGESESDDDNEENENNLEEENAHNLVEEMLIDLEVEATTGETNESSEETNKCSGETNKSSEEAKKSSEEANKSSEEAKKSSGEAKKSSEEAKKSSEEAKKSSEGAKKSLEEAKKSTEETRKSPEETESGPSEASAAQCLVEFLQRVVSENLNIGPVHDKIIEVLQESGFDEELIEKLKKNDNSRVEGLKKQLDEALAAKSAAEAKLGQLRGKIGESSDEEEGAASNETSTPPLPRPGTSGSPVPPPPPPMGGMLPPPPPPGMPTGQDTLPLGLKPKRKWRTSGSFRKANWKKIVPQNMTEKAFWLKVEEESLAKSHILSELDEKFSAKPEDQTTKAEDKRRSTGTIKKIKQVKVLDSKVAQNISIFLGGSFKQMDYDAIKTSLLQCDDKILTENIVEQLIQYLPPMEQLKELQEYKENYQNLVEAEQFCLKLSDIERLVPRLKAMQLRHRYRDMKQDCKPNIISITAACEEVKKSKKFSKILELILLLGNYMNSGSGNAQAFGFEMSFLPKLKSTKDVRNQSTLLNFLVETIEKDFPEVLDFHDELPHIDEASKVSMEIIGNTLKQIGTSLKTLEAELHNHKTPQNKDDKFMEVMEVFCKEAKLQSNVLLDMFKTLENLHEDLAEYLVFDKKTCTLKDFFMDITSFKNSFMEVKNENARKRELEAKREKARAAKEEADKEKKQNGNKSAVKEAETLNDEGLSSLLDVLKNTGEFSKLKRKRPHHILLERKTELPRSRSRSRSRS